MNIKTGGTRDLLCVETVKDLYSPLFTSIHLYSPLFTSFHLFSPLFTSFHLFSPLFTSIYLFSPLFTSIYLFAPLFTSIHLYSPFFTSIHLFSCLFTCIHLPFYAAPFFLWIVLTSQPSPESLRDHVTYQTCLFFFRHGPLSKRCTEFHEKNAKKN